MQFDTTKNRFLAAGDEFTIKFWDMDNVQILTSIDADGGLPVSFYYLLICLFFLAKIYCIQYNDQVSLIIYFPG